MTETGYQLSYVGPSGRSWQLQGPDQNAHPVTLLRKPVGLFGPPVDVQRRRVLASRNTFRVSTLPQQSNIELSVEITPPDQKIRSMYQKQGGDFLSTVRDWLSDWPVDDGTSVAPPTGSLVVKHPQVATRYLDVYRTEEVESLLPLDPMVAMRARFLMVCSSDDPYPRLDDETLKTDLPANSAVGMSLRNKGEIAVAPRITVDAPAGKVTVEVKVRSKSIARFDFNTPGPGTFDLDPNALTFSLAGDVKPLEWWWEPKLAELGAAAQALIKKHGTPQAATTPIAAPWGQNADALIPAGEPVLITVTSSQAGKVSASLTPRVERLLF